MSYKTKFIVFEGMDNCGKSTLLQNTAASYQDAARELKFKKTLPSGDLLRITTEKDFEIMFTLFEHLDQDYVYLMDRFIPSNMVYDKVLRNEDISLSQAYWKEFNDRFDVTTIILTRPKIKTDFIDDRIALSQTEFNQALDEYKLYGKNYQLLDRDSDDEPDGVRQLEAWDIAEVIRVAFDETIENDGE